MGSHPDFSMLHIRCSTEVFSVSLLYYLPDGKVLMELQRRKWPTLEVGPLEEWRKRDIVQAFLKRSLMGRCAEALAPPTNNASDGPSIDMPQCATTFLTGMDFQERALGSVSSVTDGSRTGGGSVATVPEGKFRLWGEPGLVLFPSMIERIVSR